MKRGSQLFSGIFPSLSPAQLRLRGAGGAEVKHSEAPVLRNLITPSEVPVGGLCQPPQHSTNREASSLWQSLLVE